MIFKILKDAKIESSGGYNAFNLFLILILLLLSENILTIVQLGLKKNNKRRFKTLPTPDKKQKENKEEKE